MSDTHDPARDGSPDFSRRRLLAGAAGAGVLGATATVGAGGPGSAERPPQPGQPVLLRGGHVLTLDPGLGDHAVADVLIDAGRIAALGPRLEVPGAAVVDVSGCIVMPGFIDTHRHLWQGQLRNLLPDAELGDYVQRILRELRPRYTPDDVHIGTRLSALGALHAGITTVLDWSHVGDSPAHADAAVVALKDSGLRAIYAYGSGAVGPDNAWPQDLARLQREQGGGEDARLRFALAAGLDTAPWRLARELGVPISIHVNGTDQLLPIAAELGSDLIYVHGCRLSPAEWRLIAETGGGLSIAGPVEMQMGHGIPPYQQALDHGVPLSLGNDVETSVSGEFFSQMRMAFALQRMFAHAARDQGASRPTLLSARDVVGIATRGGAEVLGLAGAVGRLSPGLRADVIVLDAGMINVAPLNDPYGVVVTAMETSNVLHVWVDGITRKWHGQVVGVDVAALLAAAEGSRTRLLAGG